MEGQSFMTAYSPEFKKKADFISMRVDSDYW
jgi:hypothetical protein